jgi:hypothetical protein
LTARLWGGETLWVCKPCQTGGQQRNDLSVSDLVDIKQLTLDGKYTFVTKGYADDFFVLWNREIDRDYGVVLDPEDSARNLAYAAQSLGLIATYHLIAEGKWEVAVSETGCREARKELERIDAAREEAWKASNEEDKAMWSDVGDILKDSFNSTDLVADIAGNLEVRAVGEVVEEYLEKAIEDAEKAIVNLIVDA